MQVLFAGNHGAGNEYLEWRFQGLTSEQCAKKIDGMSATKRKIVTELYIGSNILVEVPQNILLFPNLRDLDLGNSCLESVPPFIGQMQTLKRIFLEKNQLARLPKEFGNLMALEELFCDSNVFAEIPTFLCALSKLTKLYFCSNQLQSVPRDVAQLVSLRSIGLSGKKLLSVQFQVDVKDDKAACQSFLKTIGSYNRSVEHQEAASQSSSSFSQVTCGDCGIVASLRWCSGCYTSQYCSEICQNRHWVVHKHLCKVVPKEDGPCSLKVLAHTNCYSAHELRSLASCRLFLRTLAKKAVNVIDDVAALHRFGLESPHCVQDGELKCASSGLLFTFGVATCLVLIICGKTQQGKAQIFLQHLSGLNYRGQPKEGVCRDLRKIFGEGFQFKSGCIIPGGFLNNDLLSPTIASSDPAMQFLVWEELAPFSWRDKLELWTGLHPTYKIEVLLSGVVKIFKDTPLEKQTQCFPPD